MYPGNTNDGLIWSVSGLKAEIDRGDYPPKIDGSPIGFTIQSGDGTFIRFPPYDISDDGFPLSLHSMKPYGAKETDPEWMRVFDKVLVRRVFYC